MLDAPFAARRGSCEISTARERLDVDLIHGYLAQSYWAAGVPRAVVERSLAHSLNFGLYGNGVQIGFARVVTDSATFAYLADVFIVPGRRGEGLGRWLIETVLTHPALSGLRRFLLATRDAHGLYAPLGFAPLARPERFMEIHRPDVYGSD